MPFVSRQCLENLKNRVNIYDVVSPVVSLKRSGRNFVGLSPFTNEKTPSFFILPEKNIFKCFSSGYAGDIFRFVELQEKLTFHEAVEAIAQRFNLDLEYENGRSGGRESRSLRKEILEIHDQAAEYYHQLFRASIPEGEAIRNYWVKERRLPLALAGEHKIGLALPKDGDLIPFLQKKRFSAEALKQCGLFYFRGGDSRSSPFRHRFKGRLMIPIRDYRSQVIGFSARQLEMTPKNDPSGEAKYINSPETPVFHKGRIVFGLDHARRHIEKSGLFVLVEGQLDAIRCWQYGIHTAVAPQGTSITEDQLRLLKRYANRVNCFLDGDAAGQKAALRLLPMAFSTGMEIRFLVLPEGKDPDSILLEKGIEAIRQLEERAESAIGFAIKSFLPQQNPSPEEKSRALTRIFDIIRICEWSVAQEEYLAEASRLLNVNFQSACNDFRRYLRNKGRRYPLSPSENGEPIFEEKRSGRLTTADYELLLLVFHYKDLAGPISEVVDSDWIDLDFPHGRLLNRILAEIHEGLWDGPRKIDHLLESDKERNCAYSILAEEPKFDDPLKTANECIRSLVKSYVKNNLEILQTELETLPTASEKISELHRKRLDFKKLQNHIPEVQFIQTTKPV